MQPHESYLIGSNRVQNNKKITFQLFSRRGTSFDFNFPYQRTRRVTHANTHRFVVHVLNQFESIDSVDTANEDTPHSHATVYVPFKSIDSRHSTSLNIQGAHT